VGDDLRTPHTVACNPPTPYVFASILTMLALFS